MDDVTFDIVCKNIRVHSFVEIPPEVPTQEQLGGKFLVAELPAGSVEPDPADWYAEDEALKGIDDHAAGQDPEVEEAAAPFDVPDSPISAYSSDFQTAEEEEKVEEEPVAEGKEDRSLRRAAADTISAAMDVAKHTDRSASQHIIADLVAQMSKELGVSVEETIRRVNSGKSLDPLEGGGTSIKRNRKTRRKTKRNS